MRAANVGATRKLILLTAPRGATLHHVSMLAVAPPLALSTCSVAAWRERLASLGGGAAAAFFELHGDGGAPPIGPIRAERLSAALAGRELPSPAIDAALFRRYLAAAAASGALPAPVRGGW